MKKPEDIVADLASSNKELAVLLDEHIDSNDGLLPYVYFGDITRYLESLAGNNDDESLLELERILDYLEGSFSTSSEVVKNLLSVSFLENLDFDEGTYLVIKSKLGKNLSSELQGIEEFRP